MSVPRVTDLDSQITSHVPPRGRVTNHPTGSDRLQELLALRAQLDTEIARDPDPLIVGAAADLFGRYEDDVDW